MRHTFSALKGRARVTLKNREARELQIMFISRVKRLTPRAPDKCGHSPTLSGKWLQKLDSASGGFFRKIPPLPITPAVRETSSAHNSNYWRDHVCEY